MQRLSDTSGDWLARDKAEDYNGLSAAAGWAPASLRTLASESVAGQAGHLAAQPEFPCPVSPLPRQHGLVFPLSSLAIVYTSASRKTFFFLKTSVCHVKRV